MTDWQSASVIITHAVGLHARPSIKFTKLAKGFAAAIEIAAAADGPWIDGKSIVRVMALKAPQSSTLHIRAKGAGAAAALAALVELVKSDFGEEAGHAAGA